MLPAQQVEDLICVLASWDRPTLVARFQQFRSDSPVDLSGEFFASIDLDRLRHIFLALCLQNQRLPEAAAASVSTVAA